MPQKSSSSKRGTAGLSTVAGQYRADVASTPSRCLRTPCELQPDGFLQNKDNRSSVHRRAEQQLTLRVDRIKQRLLECQSESVSQTGSKRSPERSARQRNSQHHFCVDHKGAESIPDDHCSQSGQSDSSGSSNTAADRIPSGRSQPAGVHASTQASPSTGEQRRSSSHSSPAVQAYEAHRVSAVNKLVKELAHKQQECRKAKLHSVALQEELAWARLTGKPRPAGVPPNTSCSRAALALDASAASCLSTQQAFDVSGTLRRKKHSVAMPSMAMHMASASAAVAAGRKANQLTHLERNSLLRQLHRDNAWLLAQLRDSNAALEQLHDRLEAEQKGSPAYKALQQTLCEEAHRRLQAVEQLQDVRRQLDSSEKQAKCWEHAAESGAAKIAELQDDVAREQRQLRAAEAKLEVAKEVSHENRRLQEKLHSYRKEVRQLESSRHARSQEAQVLQAQLRELEGILSDRHEDITNLHDQLATSHSRVAELELMRGRELGDHAKLEKLEVCTENLVKRLQLDHDQMAAEKSELMKEGSTLKSKLVAAKQHAAVLQAQLRVVKEESKETEDRLLRQLKEVQADRNICLEAACRADNVLSRFGDEKLLGSDCGRASSPREKARALEDLQARLSACSENKGYVDRATTALDGITAAGTSMLKLKGREARSGTGAQTSPAASTASGRFAQLFQDIHALQHPHSA
ncbi:TPA: hypothetical protein ACH3X1_003703 [Trebouxia sp. C0004]